MKNFHWDHLKFHFIKVQSRFKNCLLSPSMPHHMSNLETPSILFPSINPDFLSACRKYLSRISNEITFKYMTREYIFQPKIQILISGNLLECPSTLHRRHHHLHSSSSLFSSLFILSPLNTQILLHVILVEEARA